MKKLYFLLLTILITTTSFSQVFITELADPNDNAGVRYIELYNAGPAAVDLSTWRIDKYTNASATVSQTLALTGTIPSEGFYIIATGAMSADFATAFGITPNQWDGAANNVAGSNGDDNLELYDGTTLVDQFGVPGVDGTGTNHEFEDGRAERNATVTSGNPLWDVTEWTIDNDGGGGAGPQNVADSFDPGAWIGASTACGVILGQATYTCGSSTIGDNNDIVTINIPYTGSNGVITSVTSTNAMAMIGGDDPATVADGTITISGLGEGDAWDVVLNGGDCDGVSTSGTVPASECDPLPNTCIDLSAGANNFELVTVTPNSQMDEWTFAGGTYSMNGFCGGGCIEAIETWMVFGPLDITAVTDLALSFDAAENFGVTDLNIVYTSAYSGCPSSTTWTTAQVISMAGSYDVDLAMASGTAVYIGVQYLDDGADGYSGWDLSNVTLDAFGTCPTLGTIVPSDCAICDVTLQAENYVCGTNTAGANNDSVTIEIPYTGVEGTITSITTTSMGMIGGDDPTLIADGTITITGLGEGDAWDLTINGGDCDGTTVSGTIVATQCDPTFLVINEINADPSNNANGEGDANGDGLAEFDNDEFVEIYNTSTSPIDMSNYVLSDASSDRHVFPMGTVLPGESFITVFGGGTPTGVPGIVQVSSTGSVGLSNGGDTVTLRSDLGVTVTQEVYGAAGNNQSIARDPDFTGAFVDHSTIVANPVLFSPGENNDGSTLSVAQFDINGFSVYPNPTNTGFVNITTTNTAVVTVSVFDMLGKQVITQTLNNNTLNVSNLKSGVYILNIKQNGTSTTKKLVIE